MVAQLSKLVFFTLALSISFPSFSNEDKAIEQSVLILVVKDVQENMAALGRIIKECDKKEKKLDLENLLLPDVDEKTMFLALLHLNIQARKKCEGDWLAKFSHSLANYNNVVNHYNIKDREAFEYEILTNDVWKTYELEVKYSNIKYKHRKIFESNIEFLSPFDPLKLLRKVNKANKSN